jgi:hypothetical protein
MTPVKKTTPTLGTQYRRLPTAGTKLAVKIGQKSRNNFSVVGYQDMPEVIRLALRAGQPIIGQSQSNAQYVDYGPVSGLVVGGVAISGTFYFLVRDLFRLA